MYTVKVPYKNYYQKPKTQTVTFQLEVRDVFKNIVELYALYNWRDERGQEDDRILTNAETAEFFNNFEAVILAAWGVISEDGEEFDRTGRYAFEQSKLFAAFMEMILSDIQMTNKILDDIMPEGMEELVRKQGESLDKLRAEGGNSDETNAAIDKIRAEYEAKLQAAQLPAAPTPATPAE